MDRKLKKFIHLGLALVLMVAPIQAVQVQQVLANAVSGPPPTWTMVQHVDAIAMAEPTHCTNATPSVCTVPLTQALGSGNLVVVLTGSNTSNNSGANITITTIAAGACSGSWQIPAATNGNDGGGSTTSGAYCLSDATNSGSTNLSVTISHVLSGGDVGYVEVIEYKWSGSTIALDGTPANTTNTASTSPSGQAQTLTGSTDIIVQWIVAANGDITAVSGSYTNPFAVSANTNMAFAGVLNTSSGTAPTWTLLNSHASGVVSMAFKGS
jgi:hypothetical protein